MIFSEFELPKHIELDDKTISALKQLWNTEYSDLYDDEYYKSSSSATSDVEEDVLQFLFVTLDLLNPNKHKILLSICLSFSLSVYPSFAYSLNDNDLTPFSKLLELAKNDELNDLGNLPALPQPIPKPVSIYEAVIVFYDFVQIIQRKDIESAMRDIIDSCLIGAGICFGSADKRAIFNWFLTYVVPYALVEETPELIYTGKIELPKEWTYKKVI